MSHYEALGVSKDASNEEIKKAHRRAARANHPDINKDKDAKEKFQVVQRAYEVLKDPERRAHYDKTGQDNKDNPESAAYNLLAHIMKTALIRTINVPWADQVRVAEMVLQEMQDSINKQRAECKQALASIKKHLGRVKKKNGGDNMYENILQEEMARVKNLEDTHPSKLETIKRTRALLKEYESPAQTPPPSQFYTSTSWGEDDA